LALTLFMARLNRLVIAGHAHHVIHRAVSGGVAFADAVDRQVFLQFLKRCSVEHGVSVHAYALLDHEFQLLVTPLAADQVSRMMQALARFYVPAFNRRHGRAGALWQGRFRAAPVAGAQALLDCMRYLEQAPQRAGWTGSLVEFPGSSAAHHAGRAADALLSAVPTDSAYWTLGNTPFARDAAYQALIERPVSDALAATLDACTPLGWALTSDGASAELTRLAPRRVSVKAKGRPVRSV
jgi:putative transposase